MKIQSRTITVEIDIDEWKKAYAEWEKMIYSDKPIKVDHGAQPNLYDLISCMQMVAQNPAFKIDKKINTY